MSMTSRERAQVALTGGIPDKVPLGDFSIDFDIAERVLGHETYVRAKAKCAIAYWEGRRDEVIQSLIEDTIELYKKLDCYDIINLSCMTLGLVPPKGYVAEKPRAIDDITWEYADGRVLKYSDITADLTIVHDPQQWTRELSLDDYPLEPDTTAPDPSVYEFLDGVIPAFDNERFLIGPYPRGTQWVQPGGLERSLIEMVQNPALVQRVLESSLAQAAYDQTRWVNRGIHGMMDGTDWAFRSGPFMSPKLWRRFCYPALEANVKAAHNAGLVFIQHACGNNWKILDAFMEADVDCYQSIQATAEMDLAKVHERCQGRMALWGGVMVEHLVSGTMDEVRQDVRNAMEIAKADGGFILGASHSIAVGTNYDNFMAMLDEFVKTRDY